MKERTHEDDYAGELHTDVQTFRRADGRFDFRIISSDTGDTLCSSSQGYENEGDAERTGSRVVRAGTLGVVTFSRASR